MAWIVLAAAPGHAQAGLREAIEDVAGADAVRYDAKDDTGAALDGLEVLALGGGGYVGVHHALVGGKFATRVATSEDLLSWRHRATLDTDAAQPSIAAAPGGGFVVAYEHGSTVRLLPRTELPTAVAGPTGLWQLNKNQLRFRFYPTLADLTAGTHSRSFTAPRRLSRTDEGTPDVTIRSGRTPRDLVLDVGFHHFADLSGDGVPDADRQGTGTLTGFRRWQAEAAPALDDLFLHVAGPHAGFATAPAGSIGDRDAVRFRRHDMVVHEAQYQPHVFKTWRLFLRDAAGGRAVALSPRTHGGSSAFGNGGVALVPLPSGHMGLLFTAFVFAEGAAPGEAGALISVRRVQRWR